MDTETETEIDTYTGQCPNCLASACASCGACQGIGEPHEWYCGFYGQDPEDNSISVATQA